MRDRDLEEFSGAVWVVETNNRDVARKLADGCPFYLVGVHKAYREDF